MGMKKDTPPELLTQSEGAKNTNTAKYAQDCINSVTSCQELFNTPESPTPHTNRGVGCTIVDSLGLKSLIDWFEFTIPVRDHLVVLRLLGIKVEEYIELEKGMYLYKNQLLCGNIRVMFNGISDDMGVHVQMSGEGCRQYEQRFGDNWLELIRGVIRLGGHFTRLDVAVDDLSGYFTIDMVKDKVCSGEVRTVFKGAGLNNSYKFGKDKGSMVDGQTVYFGSKHSELRIRFYDKALEQGVDYFWNRTEVQSRNDRSQMIAVMLMGGTSLGNIVFGILKRYVNFVEKDDGDSNRSRWAVSDWWSRFIGDVDRVKLTIAKGKKTINQVAFWIERQVAPSLALLRKAWGEGFGSFYQSLLFSGEERLKERHLLLLAGSGLEGV